MVSKLIIILINKYNNFKSNKDIDIYINIT